MAAPPQHAGPRAGTILAATLVIAFIVLAASVWWLAHGWAMNGHMAGMMGGGRDTSRDAAVIGAARNTIEIRDYSFHPGNLVIPVGAEVTWINHDSAPHNAVARDRSWSTDILSDGDDDAITFPSPGDFTYVCTIHPSMVARLTVR